MIPYTTEDSRRVEAMVTAVLADDPEAQAAVAEGLSEEAERLLRAGASIIGANYRALANGRGLDATDLWARQVMFIEGNRSERGE